MHRLWISVRYSSIKRLSCNQIPFGRPRDMPTLITLPFTPICQARWVSKKWITGSNPTKAGFVVHRHCNHSILMKDSCYDIGVYLTMIFLQIYEKDMFNIKNISCHKISSSRGIFRVYCRIASTIVLLRHLLKFRANGQFQTQVSGLRNFGKS